VKKLQFDDLCKTVTTIKGNEPFISYHNPTIILNVRSKDGRSHTFLDNLSGVDFSRLKKEDRLYIALIRVSTVDVPWYDSIRKFFRWVGEIMSHSREC
jgi:hypothetical protein